MVAKTFPEHVQDRKITFQEMEELINSNVPDGDEEFISLSALEEVTDGLIRTIKQQRQDELDICKLHMEQFNPVEARESKRRAEILNWVLSLFGEQVCQTGMKKTT